MMQKYKFMSKDIHESIWIGYCLKLDSNQHNRFSNYLKSNQTKNNLHLLIWLLSILFDLVRLFDY